MLALRKEQPTPGVGLHHVPPPEPRDDEVIVAVHAAGICGSDLHIDDWQDSYHFVANALPVTLGHEFTGRVVARGPFAGSLEIGSPVVVRPSVTCGVCEACRAGRPEECSARAGIGLTRDGGFAPLVAVPARNCIALPDGLDLDLAALTEPLTVAQQAVDRGGIGAGSRVAVLGPGSIGQGMAVLARIAGAAEVAVCGRDDAARLRTVRALGFDAVFDLAEDRDLARLRALAGRGFDVVLEATGAAAVLPVALGLLRTGGTLVAGGIFGAAPRIDMTTLVRRELQMRGSYRSPIATWGKVLSLLAASPASFAPMISHRLPLEQGIEAFATAHRRDASKILLFPPAA